MGAIFNFDEKISGGNVKKGKDIIEDRIAEIKKLQKRCDAYKEVSEGEIQLLEVGLKLWGNDEEKMKHLADIITNHTI